MEPFVAEIGIFGFNFAPRFWAQCNGQLLPISQNTALFSLLGTTYGGNGQTTFGLPELRGRVAIGQGNGPGLPTYQLGQKGGQESVTLNTTQIPAHNHAIRGNNVQNQNLTDDPSGTKFFGHSPVSQYSTGTPVQLAPGLVQVNGGSQGHNNMQPFLTVNFCIALSGIYPSQN